MQTLEDFFPRYKDEIKQLAPPFDDAAEMTHIELSLMALVFKLQRQINELQAKEKTKS